MSVENSISSISENNNQLIIKHAGSLGGAFGEINNEFKRLNPGVDIVSGGGGSAALVRDTVRGVPCGILASADYNLIPIMMVPEHADWYLIFASSRMVLRYTEQSKYSQEINAHNWFDIIQRDAVTIWHSDPNEDPGGYRTLMVLQLAESYYKVPGLYKKLMTPEHDRIISRSNFQESASGYSFGYGLRGGPGNSKTMELPDEINLSRQEMVDLYKKAEVRLSGTHPEKLLVLHGEPVLFGLTIPNICLHKDLAFTWVELLLSETGSILLQKSGLVPIKPVFAGDVKRIPQSLRSRVQ
jgi:molybdate/tungstate transport system substrate-binding protein